MRTRVKICGFTRVEDAVSAATLGADAIGLVFYEGSPRFVELQQARRIVAALPAFVGVTGLFVNAEPAYVEQVLREVALDCLQFHGDESPEDCRRYGKPYIKAIRMRPELNYPEIEQSYQDARGLLLDAYVPDGARGGTGGGFDWSLVPRLRTLPVILAGGLRADNAAAAIAAVHPHALDVSSGVEAAKGIKDPAKMAEFLSKTYQTIRIT